MPKTAAQLKKEKARQAKLEKFQKKQEALKAKAAAQVRLVWDLIEFLPADSLNLLNLSDAQIDEHSRTSKLTNFLQTFIQLVSINPARDEKPAFQADKPKEGKKKPVKSEKPAVTSYTFDHEKGEKKNVSGKL